MKTKYTIIIAAMFITMIAGYGTYNVQKEEPLSNLLLSNIDALANDESVSTADCVPDDRYSCEALHPTDPSQDQIRDNAVWK